VKLFQVRVIKTLYVMAEDEGTAADEGEYFADQATESAGGEVEVTPVTREMPIAYDWHLDSLVYGTDEDMTLKQAIDATEAA